jgi:periplasmic protein TonB
MAGKAFNNSAVYARQEDPLTGDIMKHTFDLRYLVPGTLATLVAAFLAGCSSAPPPAATPAEAAAPAQVQPAAQAPAPVATTRKSNAPNAKAYRQDAATHLYGLNQDRIYKGRMPPLLYAVGVLQVEVDSRGNVRDLNWMRAPKHAPEVVAEIERTVRAAAPFPAPDRMGKVVYTDTWLWHKSGRFQLDTLTEGQD